MSDGVCSICIAGILKPLPFTKSLLFVGTERNQDHERLPRTIEYPTALARKRMPQWLHSLRMRLLRVLLTYAAERKIHDRQGQVP